MGKIIKEEYDELFFKNPATKEKADEFGLTSIENEDLTEKGLIAKALEWDEQEHGMDTYIYKTMKALLGNKMPNVRIITHEDNKMSRLSKVFNKVTESFDFVISGTKEITDNVYDILMANGDNMLVDDIENQEVDANKGLITFDLFDEHVEIQVTVTEIPKK